MVRLVAVKLVVALTISVITLPKLSVEDCHFVTLPVLPLKVRTVEFVLAHTEALLLTDPATVTGLTVTVAMALLALTQLPL